MVKKIRVDYMDVEELACHILNIDYDEYADDRADEIEDKLYDKFEIGLDSLQSVVEYLLPMIDVGESPLTKKSYKGFSNGSGRWLIKTEA